MSIKTIKNELKNILQGTGNIGKSELISTITNYLKSCEESSIVVKGSKHYKEKETEKLIAYIESNQLWNCNIDFKTCVSSGAEQKVFIRNEKTVLKLNDSIYYEPWLDHFNNLLYYNPDLGIILEDLHDENVLTANGILFFIDTVFYIKDEIFWNS